MDSKPEIEVITPGFVWIKKALSEEEQNYWCNFALKLGSNGYGTTGSIQSLHNVQFH